MKATNTLRRGIAALACALLLGTVSLTFVSCTRNEMSDPKDTTSGTTETKPSENHGGTGMGTMPGSPLDPDAGTVNPEADPGDPPAGTGESRSYRPNFMH